MIVIRVEKIGSGSRDEGHSGRVSGGKSTETDF